MDEGEQLEQPATIPLLALQHLLGKDAFVHAQHIQCVHECGESCTQITEQAWLATNGSSKKKPVVVKSYRANFFSNSSKGSSIRAFSRECARLSKLQHKHLLRVIGMGCWNPGTWKSLQTSAFLCEEYGGSMTLARLIRAGQLTPFEPIFAYTYLDALRWMTQLADVLAYLHQQGVFHGDIRCANLFFAIPNVHLAELRLGDLKPHRHWYHWELQNNSNVEQQDQVVVVLNQERSSQIETTIHPRTTTLPGEPDASAGTLPQYVPLPPSDMPASRYIWPRLKGSVVEGRQGQEPPQVTRGSDQCDGSSNTTVRASLVQLTETTSASQLSAPYPAESDQQGWVRESDTRIQQSASCPQTECFTRAAGHDGNKAFLAEHKHLLDQVQMDRKRTSRRLLLEAPRVARASWSCGAGPTWRLPHDADNKPAFQQQNSGVRAAHRAAGAPIGGSPVKSRIHAPVVRTMSAALIDNMQQLRPGYWALGSGHRMASEATASDDGSNFNLSNSQRLYKSRAGSKRSPPSFTGPASVLPTVLSGQPVCIEGSSPTISMDSASRSLAWQSSSRPSPSQTSTDSAKAINNKPGKDAQAALQPVVEHEGTTNDMSEFLQQVLQCANPHRQCFDDGCFERATYHVPEDVAVDNQFLDVDVSDIVARSKHKEALKQQVDALGITPEKLSLWTSAAQDLDIIPSAFLGSSQNITVIGGLPQGCLMETQGSSPRLTNSSLGWYPGLGMSLHANGSVNGSVLRSNSNKVMPGPGGGASIRKPSISKKAVSFVHHPPKNKLAAQAQACIHAPPEALQEGTSAACCTAAGDVYAFGMVMYSVLARRLIVMEGGTDEQQWAWIQDYVARAAQGHREIMPECWPVSICKLIDACWATHPIQRPTMAAVAARLRSLQDDNSFRRLLVAADREHSINLAEMRQDSRYGMYGQSHTGCRCNCICTIA